MIPIQIANSTIDAGTCRGARPGLLDLNHPWIEALSTICPTDKTEQDIAIPMLKKFQKKKDVLRDSMALRHIKIVSPSFPSAAFQGKC